MVNMDKWEKVEYSDLKVGDKILRINKHDDGTRAVVKGTVSLISNYGYASKGKFILCRPTYNFPTELYRRKTKPFNLPTNVGAIITGVRSRGIFKGEKFTFVLVHGSWTAQVDGQRYHPTSVLSQFEDFTILSEGIKP